MTEYPAEARPAQTYAEVEDALLSRWPESRLEPTLDRIQAFTELLGEPQASYPVVHLTGTNGKTSTARMVETLIRGLGLRTGRFTSPHLETMNERIVIDGVPLSDDDFVRIFNEIAPYTHLVDADHDNPLSFFETVVGMAFAAFADAPVDAAVIEVGMGGSWDATNVADGAVAVLTPVAVDHAQYLGSTVAEIAREKVGIIKPGATVITAIQEPDVAAQIVERAAEVGAIVAREGLEFGVITRVPAVGGRCSRCKASAASTTRSSCRCTDRTRPRTQPWRSQRWRRSSVVTSRSRSRSSGMPSPRSRLPAAWRSSGARRRSCSTRRTTRTVRPHWSRRSTTRSPSTR